MTQEDAKEEIEAARARKKPSAPKTLADARRLLEKELNGMEQAADGDSFARGRVHGLSIALGVLEFAEDGRQGWSLERALDCLKSELGARRRILLQDSGTNSAQSYGARRGKKP